MTLQVGVKVLLKNKEGKILVLKRSEEKYGKTDGEPVLDLSESTTYRWVTFDELASMGDLDVFVKKLIAADILRSDSWG